MPDLLTAGGNLLYLYSIKSNRSQSPNQNEHIYGVFVDPLS